MISNLSNVIKSHAAGLDQSAGQIKFCTVTSVNSNNATARVLIQPENVLSGWLSILSQWVGSGWGMVCPPNPGEQVLVVPQEGDVEQGIIIGGVFSTQQKPPVAPDGEFWLVHQSGSFPSVPMMMRHRPPSSLGLGTGERPRGYAQHKWTNRTDERCWP
jgi:hypothetical protein